MVLPTAAAATEATARPDGVVERRYRLREAALAGAGAPRDCGSTNRQSRKQRCTVAVVLRRIAGRPNSAAKLFTRDEARWK